jgi:hypothetical protein
MIRITQCLCPARHCILGFAYVPGVSAAQRDFGSMDDITLTEANAADYLKSMVEGLIERQAVNPWCGICNSQKFYYEDRPTSFRTMEEARPELERMEAENARARMLLQNKN